MRGNVLWWPTSSAPKVRMSAAARTSSTPKNRPTSRRARGCCSSCSSWRMASGMARSHRGVATGEVLNGRWPPGRLEAGWAGSRGRRGPGRRPAVRCACRPRVGGCGSGVEGHEPDHGRGPAPGRRPSQDRLCGRGRGGRWERAGTGPPQGRPRGRDCIAPRTATAGGSGPGVPGVPAELGLDRPSSRAAGPRVPTATRDLRFDRIGPERSGRLTGSRRRKGIGGGIVVP